MIEIDDKIGRDISNGDASSLNESTQQPKTLNVSIPKKVKLEITTTLEAIALGLIAFSALLTFLSILYCNSNNMPIFSPITCVFIVLIVVFVIVKMNIDEYYVLDSGHQALMLKSKVFSKETYTVFAPFRAIDAVVANGRYNSGGKNRPSYWTYRAEIVLNTGKVIPIEDWQREKFIQANRKAEKFATLAHVAFVQGAEHHSAKAKKVGTKYSFVIKEHSVMLQLMGSIVIMIIFAVVWLFAKGSFPK